MTKIPKNAKPAPVPPPPTPVEQKPTEPLLPPAPVSKAAYKRIEALRRFHGLGHSIRSINKQLNDMQRQAEELQRQAILHEGASVMLRDVFQFTPEELANVPPQAEVEKAAKEETEPKYD